MRECGLDSFEKGDVEVVFTQQIHGAQGVCLLSWRQCDRAALLGESLQEFYASAFCVCACVVVIVAGLVFHVQEGRNVDAVERVSVLYEFFYFQAGLSHFFIPVYSSSGGCSSCIICNDCKKASLKKGKEKSRKCLTCGIFNGQGGIRTLGTLLTYTRFPMVCCPVVSYTYFNVFAFCSRFAPT